MAEFKDNKKSFDSQLKIYKSLRRVLLIKPFNEVSVADILKDSGVSSATFYRNFNNLIEVLEIMLDYYYNEYKEFRRGKINQLLFFYEHWNLHKDLVRIISENSPQSIVNCIAKFDGKGDNPFSLEIRASLFMSIICKWSRDKVYTPKDMVDMTKTMMTSEMKSILLNL